MGSDNSSTNERTSTKMTDNNEKHIGEEIDEILKDVPLEEDKTLPSLPLVFTARTGETRQIGFVELQLDGTIKTVVYAGAENVLPILFSMPLAFHIDGNVKFSV